jgi:hypothetical protein
VSQDVSLKHCCSPRHIYSQNTLFCPMIHALWRTLFCRETRILSKHFVMPQDNLLLKVFVPQDTPTFKGSMCPKIQSNALFCPRYFYAHSEAHSRAPRYNYSHTAVPHDIPTLKLSVVPQDTYILRDSVVPQDTYTC